MVPRCTIGRFFKCFEPLSSELPPQREMSNAIPLEEGSILLLRPTYHLSSRELEAKRRVQKFFVDDNALSKHTIKTCTPYLEWMIFLINLSRCSKISSSIDLVQGYHHLLISNDDIHEAVFRIPFEHYQFKVLSFGSTIAPTTFEIIMNQIFFMNILASLSWMPWWYICIFKEWRETYTPYKKSVVLLFWFL